MTPGAGVIVGVFCSSKGWNLMSLLRPRELVVFSTDLLVELLWLLLLGGPLNFHPRATEQKTWQGIRAAFLEGVGFGVPALGVLLFRILFVVFYTTRGSLPTTSADPPTFVLGRLAAQPATIPLTLNPKTPNPKPLNPNP